MAIAFESDKIFMNNLLRIFGILEGILNFTRISNRGYLLI